MAGIEMSNVTMLIDTAKFTPSAMLPHGWRRVFPGSFVPVFVSVTGTNTKRLSQAIAEQELAKGVLETSGEDRIRTCGRV